MSVVEPSSLRAAASGQPTWFVRLQDRWRSRIARLLASERFRHWAAGFPLTRPIARRRARALFDLCAGFVYSQILQACVQLRVFELLADGPRSAAELAPQLGLTLEAAERLLAAARALRLLAPASRGRYRLGELGAPLLGNRAITAMVEHHALLYADLRDPVALLRGERVRTALGDYWPYDEAADTRGFDPGRSDAYSGLMSASQPLVARELLDAYPFERHQRLLDVGGGEGSFLASVAARVPNLKLMLFDLPPVAARARQRLAAQGLADRTSVVGGSFRTDALPSGADLVTLVRVVHDHDDDVVRALLCAVREALPPGGVLLIAEPMSDTPGAEPVGDAYFGFYLLAMGRGRPRSAERLSEMLLDAGFIAPRLLPTRMPLQTRVLCAVVPG